MLIQAERNCVYVFSNGVMYRFVGSDHAYNVTRIVRFFRREELRNAFVEVYGPENPGNFIIEELNKSYGLSVRPADHINVASL